VWIASNCGFGRVIGYSRKSLFSTPIPNFYYFCPCFQTPSDPKLLSRFSLGNLKKKQRYPEEVLFEIILEIRSDRQIVEALA
jgi:hypothetical protein